MVAAIRHADPDIVVLNEYVDGPLCDDLKTELALAGFHHVHVSDGRSGHNQILFASRPQCAKSPLTLPATDTHAATNFLAIQYPEYDLTVVGMRAPAYKTAQEPTRYWHSVTRLLETQARQRIVMVGDMNADPNAARAPGGKALARLRAAGWRIPNPTGDWNWMSPKGITARIDHVVASPAIASVSAMYLMDVAKASDGRQALSDHAMLLCEIEV